MATLAVPITDRETYLSPNVVKVVCDDGGRALYFSRSPIPMVRDGEPDFTAGPLGSCNTSASTPIAAASCSRSPRPAAPAGRSRSSNNFASSAPAARSASGLVAQAHRGVDTPADYAAFVRTYRELQGRRAA